MSFFFFFNDTATTEIYTLSLHDALPISRGAGDHRMTLLDPPPVTPQKSRAIPFTIAAVVVAAVVMLYFAFRYYPEKKAAERFFNALVAGNTDLAYQLWKPGPSYTKRDFLADWGPEGYYGPVKS